MSNLKTIEKKVFEDLLGMGEGFVLDFNNSAFAAFFREAVNKDIYSKKYAFNGDSKAKRLRAFWEVESDKVVGKVLSELLEIWHYNEIRDGRSPEETRYNAAKGIVAKLTGEKLIKRDPEQEFLSRKYQDISISNLGMEAELVPILESRLKEAQQCLTNAPLATIFLCGSILEGILLGVALQCPKEFNQAANAPKKDGKVRALHKWTLSQFIDVAHGLGLLKLDVKKFSHELRDFRNYIHPYQQMTSKFSPDKHTAEICLQVLKAAIASLCGSRK